MRRMHKDEGKAGKHVPAERVRSGTGKVQMRVLLIEDEEAIAEEIKEGLEEERFRVDIASDGLTGLDMAEEGGYAVILLDLMLPGISGWEVCQRLRARRDITPILMLTARDAPPDRVRGLEIGADDYLPKP